MSTDYNGFDVRREGNVAVLRCTQRQIVLASQVKELTESLNSIASDHSDASIVLNVQDVEFLSAAMLNGLIILQKQLQGGGRDLRFCHLRPEIYEVFVITRLNQFFRVVDTEKDAIQQLM